MVADFPDPPPPGRFGRWLTELFNDWPEGARPALGEGDARGPSSRRAGRELTAGCGILLATHRSPGGPVGATGLSTDAKEYRARLAGQADAQIDAWVSELMRDVAIRRGIVKVVEDFRRRRG